MMKYVNGARVWILVAALAVPAGLSAQDPTPIPGQAQLDPYVVGTALPPLDAGRTMVSMTLDQALERALERNLDIQTARLNPRMQAFSLQAARAAFTPTLSGTYGYSNQARQSTSQLGVGIGFRR